jgi:phosphoribosylaminoimidazole carboxylase PurE protein
MTERAGDPLVGVIMGSESDMDVMAGAMEVLNEFEVPHEVRIISAHRTPKEMSIYAEEAKGRGLQVIIAGAGGSAHLQGMTASETILPVLAVPIKRPTHDHEALWSCIKMPPGIPLATMPENGADRAALFAVRILALTDNALATRYEAYVKAMHDKVIDTDADVQTSGWETRLPKK